MRSGWRKTECWNEAVAKDPKVRLFLAPEVGVWYASLTRKTGAGSASIEIRQAAFLGELT